MCSGETEEKYKQTSLTNKIYGSVLWSNFKHECIFNVNILSVIISVFSWCFITHFIVVGHNVLLLTKCHIKILYIVFCAHNSMKRKKWYIMNIALNTVFTLIYVIIVMENERKQVY